MGRYSWSSCSGRGCTPALVAWVPAGFHAYFLAAGIVYGVIFQPPVLLAASLLMVLVAALLYYPQPLRQAEREPARPPP